MLPGVLLAQGTDSLDNHHLEKKKNNHTHILNTSLRPKTLTSGLQFPKLWTLNSSEISETKEEICFMSRSTLLSLPVFSSVVMARVAMLRFESVIRFSRSRLQAVTAEGCFIATWWTPWEWSQKQGRMPRTNQSRHNILANNSETVADSNKRLHPKWKRIYLVLKIVQYHLLPVWVKITIF